MDWVNNGGEVFTRRVGTRLHVRCPRNDDFVIAAHKLRGGWKYRTGTWTFPDYSFLGVVRALNTVFGVNIGTKLRAPKNE